MNILEAPSLSPRGIVTVRGQLSIIVAIGVSVGFLIIIGLQIQGSRARAFDEYLDRKVQTTQFLAANLYGAARWHKPAIIQKGYHTLLSQHADSFEAAVTLDREGKRLTSFQKGSLHPPDLQQFFDQAANTPKRAYSNHAGNRFIVVAPLLSNDGSDRSGSLAVVWNLDSFSSATNAASLQEGSIAIVTLGFFLVGTLIFLNRRLSRPLADITAATARIANGDKRFEVPWTGRRDEIGAMARALVTFRENVALIDRLTAEQQQQTLRLSTALEKEKEYSALHREFVSMVSHEFRTPVAIIDGAAQRIARRAEKDTPEELRERTEKIRSAAARMIELIDSTLSFSRLEAGTVELKRAPCDFAGLLTEICERQQSISKKHEIKLSIAGVPPELLIDASRMDQVITNLLSNAVKYSPTSSRIDVTCRVQAGDVVVMVQDRGLGIPQDELPKLFEKFFRARTSTGIPGTGIGLHLVKLLTELHQGSIGVESSEGNGTVFTLRFPIWSADEQFSSRPGAPAPPTIATA
ncbi:MAG: ATP-binding protein [Kiloniellaceae bacterium]